MKVLAIGCHPDDLEIGCGGTLARYVQLNHQVYMCHLASGNYGHAQIIPDELKKIRKKEAYGSAKILGAEQVYDLDMDDLTVHGSNQKKVDELIWVIREVKPDVIITHAPNDYMKDHRETGKMAFDASFSATVPQYRSQYPAHQKVCPLYYMDTVSGMGFQPQEYVDITQTLDIKLNALSQHESQIKWLKDHDDIDFLDFVKTTSKFRGNQCGVAYAEGFIEEKTWPRVTTKRWLP